MLLKEMDLPYTPMFSDEIIVEKDHVVFQHNDSRTHQS